MSVEENSSGSSDSEDESVHLSSEDEETVEVEGFQIHVSKENKVKEMFKNHPDLSTNVNLGHQHCKDAYMDLLLDVIETLSQSTNVFSWKDIIKSNSTLIDLTRVGFSVLWLSQRLDELYVKVEQQRVRRARIKVLQKRIKIQKLKLSNLKSDLKKEKTAEAQVD